MDFPDIIHGHNVAFFFFYSGHCAMPALVAKWVTYPHGPLPSQWPIHVLNVLQAIRMLVSYSVACSFTVWITYGDDGYRQLVVIIPLIC
jgi:hypothetical protein